MYSSTVLLSIAVGFVKAHTIFQRVHVNGVDQGYLNGVRYPTVSNLLTPGVLSVIKH